MQYLNELGIHPNEIRDFLYRAPPRRKFDGARIINFDDLRHRWLNEIHCGSIDQRINRRSLPDYVMAIVPWHNRRSWYLVRKSINRHHRRELIKTYSGCRRLW